MIFFRIQDDFSSHARGPDSDGAAPLLQAADDIMLGAVVDQGDPAKLLPVSREILLHIGGHRVYRVLDRKGMDFTEI